MELTSVGVFAPLFSVGSKFVNSFKRHTEDTFICGVPFCTLQNVHCDLSMFLCGIFTLHLLPGYLELGMTDLFCFTADLTEGRLFFTNKDHDQRSINVCSCSCKVPIMSCLILTNGEMC